MILQYFTNQI